MSNDPNWAQPGAGAPRPSAPTSKKPILIIVALVVVLGAVPCLGIVAAISIPAFIRYIKKSKSSEAEMTIARMANEVELHAMEACEFPPELPPHARIADCSDGAKCLPNGELPAFWADAASLNEPKYFVYSATIDGNVMTLRAEANFNAATPEFHTHQMSLTLTDCAVDSGAPITLNEFD